MKTLKIFSFMFMFSALVISCGDAAEKGPMEKAGETIDATAKDTKDAATKAMDDTKAAADKAIEDAKTTTDKVVDDVKDATDKVVDDVKDAHDDHKGHEH